MNVKIGEKIKKLRKRDDITQERLAEVLGVTSQAISKWESESGYPDIEYIIPIAAFFNVTTDYLFGYDKYKKCKEINVFFGLSLLSIFDDNNIYGEEFIFKIQNLRKELKDDFNIDMPQICLRDNTHLSQSELAIEVDGRTLWKYDFGDDKNFEAIGDIIINNIKNIQLQIYGKFS